MTSSTCLVLLGDRGEGSARAADRTLRAAVDRLEAVEIVPDAATATRLVSGGGGRPVGIAVIGPTVDRPLSVGRDLRRADGTLGLVFVVAPDGVPTMETRLGLLPELAGATVVAANGAPDQLADRLTAVATATARRREVRGALDAMNRQLLRSEDDPGRGDRQSVSASYLAALVRHVPEAIVSVDGTGIIVALNDAAAATFDVDARQVEGRAIDTVLDRATNPALHDLVDGALEGETVTGRELELVVPDRSLLAVVTAAPVRDHADRIRGAVLLVRDVTERRRTQQRLQELQKAQSLATLAGGVAHDFNNLLVAVRGWAELAAEQPGDADLVARALDRILVSAERAGQLARSMLVYSGRGRFEPAPVDVSQVVREVVDLLHGSVSRKTTLELELADDLPNVRADVSQLRQVVMNLVTNAAEALGDEGGTITVCTSAPERLPATLAGQAALGPGHPHVLLEVADTGPGMDEATRRRVFEPFFTTKFEGRGLGLAASHGIVAAHGGALVVDSSPGRGATFRMALPATEGAHP